MKKALAICWGFSWRGVAFGADNDSIVLSTLWQQTATFAITDDSLSFNYYFWYGFNRLYLYR